MITSSRNKITKCGLRQAQARYGVFKRLFHRPKFVFQDNEELLKFVNETFFHDEKYERMLNKTHSGSSSEDAVSGILTRIGFCTAVRRQSDYGIDFLCAIGRVFGESIFPTQTFTVQLKTNFDNEIIDISNAQKYDWLINNKLPFFHCVYDEGKGDLYFYSTSLLHDYAIHSRTSTANKLSLKIQEPQKKLTKCAVNYDTNNYTNKRKIYQIDCGQPFLKINVLDTPSKDPDKFDKYKDILEKIITKEKENIAYRHLNLPFMSWVHQYKMNDPNILFGWADFSDDKLIGSNELLKSLGQPIMTLAKTFEVEGDTESYEKLRVIVDKIPFEGNNQSSLVNLGFRNHGGTKK
jgi:hypothetical protein